ncbi:PREDICTED: uncharacterized protein LOC107073642, partial [Polistes dominula]|uniref:Uncharacterized protein LOC107073642 n=1 Tax=Polistes dominula TaxID=743375 RepID=A0ABM1JBI4_POLDO
MSLIGIQRRCRFYLLGLAGLNRFSKGSREYIQAGIVHVGPNRSFDKQIDPRLAKLDQSSRGPLQTQTIPVSMLRKANPNLSVLKSSEKPMVHEIPPRIKEPSTAARPSPVVAIPSEPLFEDITIDPRLARLDQSSRGPPQTQTIPVTVPPIRIATADPRVSPTTFTLPDNNLSVVEGVESFYRDLRVNGFGRNPRDPRNPRMSIDPVIAKPTPPVPVEPSILTSMSYHIVADFTVPPLPVVVTNTNNGLPSTTALTTSTNTPTSKLMVGMSPAGIIPNSALNKEK